MNIENDYVASFSNGLVKGLHIGNTSAVYNNSQRIEITVNPTVKYTYYPSDKWNASMSEVEQYINSQKVNVDHNKNSNGIIDIVAEGGKGSNIKFIYYHSFKNGKLTGSTILTPVPQMETYVKWISEKYLMIPTNSSEKNFSATGCDAYDLDKANTSLLVLVQTLNTNSNAQYTLSTNYWIQTVLLPFSSTKSIENFDIPEDVKLSLSKLGYEIE